MCMCVCVRCCQQSLSAQKGSRVARVSLVDMATVSLLLVVLALASSVHGRFGLPFNRCSLTRMATDQMALQAQLASADPCGRDKGRIGVIGQPIASEFIPFLITGDHAPWALWIGLSAVMIA